MDTDKFDPYYKWLGIPPDAQPPDHYRLLGVKLFEEDREVIASAADRQMAHVKTFAVGKHGYLSQKVLDELARARICLLNPTKKTAYDAELLKRIGGSQAVATMDENQNPAPVASVSIQPKPVAPAQDPSGTPEIQINSYPIPRRRRPAGRNVAAWYLLAVLLAITGALIVHLESRQATSSPSITISLNGNDASEAGPRIAKLTVQLSSVAATRVDGQLTLGGSATYGEDYRLHGRSQFDAGSLQFTLPPGLQSQEFLIEISDDQLVESVETIEVSISKVKGGQTVVEPADSGSRTTIRISDNDTAKAFVAVNTRRDGFTVQLTKPSSAETVITFDLLGLLPTNQQLRKRGTLRIPPGATFAEVVNETLLAGKLQLLSVMPRPQIELDLGRVTSRFGTLESRTPLEDPQWEPERRPDDEPEPPRPKLTGLPRTVDLPITNDDGINTFFNVPSGVSLRLIPSTELLALVDDRLEWQDGNTRKLIGGLAVREDEVQFRWVRPVPPKAETALRNSVIELSLEEVIHRVELRSAEFGEPFRFDLREISQRVVGNCENSPDPEQVYFIIPKLDSLPTYKEEPLSTSGVQCGSESCLQYSQELVKTVIEVRKVGRVPVAVFTTSFELPSGDSRALTWKQLTTVERELHNELNRVDALITNLNQVLKKPPRGQRAALQAQLKECEEEKKAIIADQIALKAITELADQLDGKELLYKFSTIVDGHEVVLIRSPGAAK